MEHKELRFPLVSIVMSIYNPEICLLQESLKALFTQTYSNIELVIVNDGMNSEEEQILLKVIQDYQNVQYLVNETNIGLTKSLNIAISKANGDLIARCDADDISDINRIRKQVECFLKRDDLGLLGTWFKVINSDGASINYEPTGPKENLLSLMFERNPFCHSSAMFRKDCFEEVGGYEESYRVTQDLDLWFRIAEKFDIDILEENLIERNIGQHTISFGGKRWEQLINSAIIRAKARRKFQKVDNSFRKLTKSFVKGFLFAVSPETTKNLQATYRRFKKK